MKQEKIKKKGLITVGVCAILLIAILGVTFAIWNYSRTTDNQILVAGDIYMKFTETNQIAIPGALPSEGPGENDYFQFTIEGKNTYSKPIWYEIDLQYGKDDVSRKTRIEDNLLKFRLVEIKDGNEQTVVDNASYSDLTNKKIWVNTIDANTKTKVEITYRLYMWISSETIIGNTSDAIYDMDTWNNDIYASIKVNVMGDFTEKKVLKSLVDIISSNVGSQGIVAVNKAGDKQESAIGAREIRYSGIGNYCVYNDGERDYKLSVEGETCPQTACKFPTLAISNGDSDDFKIWNSCEANGGTTINLKEDIVNDSGLRNYVIFNDEMWRIVGVFNNKIKLVKDLPIASGIIPNTYTSTTNQKKYNLIYSEYQNQEKKTIYEYVSFNDPISEDYDYQANDWTQAGLQYWLNEEYYKTIDEKYQKMMVDDEYYLGNVDEYPNADDHTYSIQGTPKEIYDQERKTTIECDKELKFNFHENSCNLWYGNQATWEGKISLLYASDFAYATDTNNWGKNMNHSFNNNMVLENWMFNTIGGATWLLSPQSFSPDLVLHYSGIGDVATVGANYADVVRPTITIKSSVVVSGGDGSYKSPYLLSL